MKGTPEALDIEVPTWPRQVRNTAGTRQGGQFRSSAHRTADHYVTLTRPDCAPYTCQSDKAPGEAKNASPGVRVNDI